MKHEWTEEQLTELSNVISKGLVIGVGKPNPGEMCVEAAICFVKGLPHGDTPPCVASPDRKFAITLNDSRWSSNEARAKGMLPLALAQLNTIGEPRQEWVNAVCLGVINRVLPMILEFRWPEHAEACREAKTLEDGKLAARCAQQHVARNVLQRAAAYAAYAAYAAADAAYAAYAAAADADKILIETVQVALDAYRRFPHNKEVK